ncbi:MAG: hypothetical protein Ta2D_11400 [Rickettsiales bacterium]|nr:MAG: hypothetical protein Ta2D_11400 [Rickettsiales bacterium]
MKDIVKQEIIDIENKVFIYNGQPVLLDYDVASFYGVETKHINQAVSRNPEKFPVGYVLQIEKNDINKLVANCDHLIRYDKYASNKPVTICDHLIESDKNTSNKLVTICDHPENTIKYPKLEKLKYSNAPIKIFTERGLYMLATILKSERATKVTLKIIDTFTKFRGITNNLNSANNSKNEVEKGEFLKKSGTALMDLLTDNLRDNDDDNIETVKTTIKLDLGIFKIEKSIEKKKK